MYRSQIRPLKSLPLRSRPLTSHAIAWSCDAELAVATEDTVYIFLPEYPGPGGDGDKAAQDVAQGQFSLSLDATGIFTPLSSVNTQLCAFVDIRLPPPGEGEERVNRSSVDGLQVTGAGASISQIVRVEWSPNGLGANLRPVLMAMTTNGELITLGEYTDPQSTVASGLRARKTKMWKILWGLGAGMPVPAEDYEGSYRTTDDRIKSFSWAKEISIGRALLAYMTDEGEVVIMSVQYFARRDTTAQSSDDFIWQLREVARFEASGPHNPRDVTDPDYVPNGTAFSLKWSPWVSSGNSLSASLAIISNNYVGFRKIVIQRDCEKAQEPNVEVDDSDTTGICLFLSADSLVEWEDTIWYHDGSEIGRGIICTPFEVTPFQVDILGAPRAPVVEHATSDCSTTYPQHPSANPITGLVIHPADPTNPSPVPLYSAVRASATPTNQDWYETNVPDTSPIPSWVQKIRLSNQRLVPREEALASPDSESDDTDDEFQEETKSTVKVHPYRFRFWGMASSPGDGSTAVLVSKHSTQVPSRRGFSSLLFGAHSTDQQGVVESPPVPPTLSTEGRMWEWMYGGGHHVPGATIAADGYAMDVDSALREFFAEVRTKQKCAFCDKELQNDGTEARCPENHTFASCSSSGLAILAPGVSRVCVVCQRRCLKDTELRKLASEHIGPDSAVPPSGELCGGCGGKFVA